MNRYFFGLALAFLLVPGVSKADVVTTLSNYGTTETGAGTAFSTSGNIQFTTQTGYVSDLLGTLSLRVHNSLGTSLTSFALNFQLDGGAVTTLTSSATQTAGYSNAIFDVSQLGNVSSGGGTHTLSYTFNSVSGGTSDDISWAINGTNPTSTVGWGFVSSTPGGGEGMFLLTASVPEPTTMLLTGSVLAAGFGASILRRFRKKPETQEVAM